MNLPMLERLGSNFTKVTLDGMVDVWFSYDTPIAFQAPEMVDPAVRENIWSTTTGKHLNAIDGGSKEAKALRVTVEEFVALWEGLS